MRIRTRDLELVSNPVGPMTTTKTVIATGLPSGVPVYSNASPAVIKQSHIEETMTDELSPVKGRKSQYVHHVKRSLIQNKLDNDQYTQGTLRYTSVGANAHWQAWGHYASTIGFEHVIQEIPVDESTAVRETMHAFYDRNEVDLLLNLVEAPELYTGLKSLNKSLQLDSVINHSAMRRGELRRKLARRINILSGGFLYYSFGVAPIISDMRKISKAMDSLKGSVAKAAERAGKVVTVRRRYTGRFTGINPSVVGSPLTGYGAVPGTGFYHIDIEPIVNPLYVCTVKGINSFGFKTDFFKKLDYLAHRFGASGPASFAWERIPFSFVLDWFLDLSGVLDKLDNALTGNHKVIKDCCVSHKWKCNLKVIHHQSTPSNSELYNDIQVASVGLAAYSRKPADPKVNIGLAGRFGKRQIRLTAALLGQMTASLKAIAR